MPLWLPQGATLAAGVAIALAVALSATAFAVEADPSFRPWPVLALWLASIALVLLGARLAEAPASRPRGVRLTRSEVAFLAALTFAATLARTLALTTAPDNFSGDEGETGEFAREILAGRFQDPFTTGWAGHPTVWFFLQALSLRLFGDDVFGLRLLSALLGAAAVPLVYLVARHGFGRRAAAIAAVLLAATHVHLHYSRVGLNSVADGLMMLVALGALLAGLRTGSRFMLACAGVAAGIAQHFYLGSRLVPLVLLAVVVHQILVDRQRLTRLGRGLGLAFLGFWIGYGPGFRVPLYQWDDYNARLAVVGVFQSGWFDARRALGDSVFEIFWRQVKQSAGAFTDIPDRSADYFPQMPLLDTVTAAFFLLGLAYCLWAWRSRESAAVLIWLGATVVTAGILLVDSPQSHRYVGAIPAAVVVAAVGIDRYADAAVAAVPRLRRAVPTLLVATVGGVVAWNVVFYFNVWNDRRLYGFRQGEELTAIGRYLKAQPAGTFVYYFGAPKTYFDVGTIRFLAHGVPGTDVLVPLKRPEDLPARPRGGRPLFIFMPERLSELEAVRSAFPNGVLWRFVSKADRKPLFLSYEPRARKRGTISAASVTIDQLSFDTPR